MEQKFTFDQSFQLMILNLMLSDDLFLLRCSNHLKDEYFENEFLGYFFKKSCSYCSRYEKSPDLTYFLNEIRKFEEKDRGPYVEYLHKIMTTPPNSAAYVKEQLTDFIKRNRFVKLYKTLPDMFQKDPDKAYRSALENSEEIVGFSFNDNQLLSLEDSEKLTLSLTSLKRSAPIGVPEIDVALGSGVSPGELITFLGDSNVGKSIFLINIGALSLQAGARVLHINLEGKKNIPVHRYHSNLSGLAYNKLKTMMFENDGEREVYRLVKEKFKDKLKIIHMNDFKVTIEDLYLKCKEIYRNFPFDVLIVDYGDLLTTQEKMDYRHQQTAVFRGLSKIAGYFEVPVVTASQATRPETSTPSESYWLTPRNVSESYEKVRVSSIIVTINRTEREELENKVRLLLCKNRDGIKNIRVGCYSDYSRMLPYGTSLGFYNPKTEVMTEDKK